MWVIALAFLCIVILNANASIFTKYAAGGQYLMLIFESGPHSVYTARILDSLKSKKARATFFVRGEKSLTCPSIIKRIVEEGHEIGLNGYDSTSFSNIPVATISFGVEKTIGVISDVFSNSTTPKIKYIYPPNGDIQKDKFSMFEKRIEYDLVVSSVDSRDWENIEPSKIVKHVISKVGPGDIVVFHDNLENTALAMDTLIDSLYERGFELLTISQMKSFPDDTPR